MTINTSQLPSAAQIARTNFRASDATTVARTTPALLPADPDSAGSRAAAQFIVPGARVMELAAPAAPSYRVAQLETVNDSVARPVVQVDRKMQTFLDSGYDDDDARLVQEYFGWDTLDEARRYIGTKIQNGQAGILAQAGAYTEREESLRAFAEQGFGREDIERAFEVFDFETEAMERIGRMARAGQLEELEALGISPNDDRALTAFAESPYGDRAVTKVMEELTSVTDEAQARQWIGQRLLDDEVMVLEALQIPQR